MEFRRDPIFFRAVLRREPEMEFDPILSSWTIEKSTFDSLKCKFDLTRLWKFGIYRRNYVAFGIVTDLERITEEDLNKKIWTMINGSNTNMTRVRFLEFKEWSYPKNYQLVDKEEKILDNGSISSSVYDPQLLFSIKEDYTIRGSWEINRVSRKEWSEPLFRRIFNTEIQYGRKRWWT